MSHPQVLWFEGIILKVQRLPGTPQIFEYAFLHRFPDPTFGKSLPFVHLEGHPSAYTHQTTLLDPYS